MKHLLSFVIAFLSFYVNAQLIKPNNTTSIDSVQITSITEISEKDIICSLTIPVIFPGMQITPSAFNLNLGGDFRLKSLKYGGVNLNYYYSIFLTELNYNPGAYGTRGVSQNNLTIQYSLPLYKHSSSESVVAHLGGKGRTYYTVLNTKKLTSFNLLLGYAKQYNLSASHGYSDVLYDTYDNPWPIGTRGAGLGAWLNQSVSMIQIGTSIQQNFNTKFFSRDKSNQGYKGRKSSSLIYYFNLNFAVDVDLAEVEYSYNPYGNPMTAGNGHSNNILEVVDMKEYVPLRKVGFSLGFEYSRFNYKNNFGVNKIGIEVGSFPGYNDNLIRSLYAKIKFIGIGFGFMTSKLQEW